MPIVRTSKPQTSQPTIPSADPDEAVCGCGANAHIYEVNGDTVPLYVCKDHERKD